MNGQTFNDDDALPSSENTFSARGEPPRRAGAAGKAEGKSGSKLVFFGLLGAVVFGIGTVFFINSRPQHVAVDHVAYTQEPSLAQEAAVMPPGEADTLFATGADTISIPSDVVSEGVPGVTMPANASGSTPSAIPMSGRPSAPPVGDGPLLEPPLAAADSFPPPPGPGAPPAAMPAAGDPASDRIAALEASMTRLSQQLDEIDKDLNVVESQLPQIRAQARQAATPRPAPRPQAAPPAPPVATRTVAAPPTGFRLKAVLEGQAWIEGRDGQTYTVAVGDAVDGLGVVTEIDAVRNEVRFPAGVNLSFR